MVLTSPEPHDGPSTKAFRGKTLPNPTLLRQSNIDLSVSSARKQKAHTLPTNRTRTCSAIELNNAINNNGNNLIRTPQSVSILSLHQSDDNEAYCFDNR